MPDKPDKTPQPGTTYRNIAGRPLVYDAAGHQLDAGTVSDPIELDEVGQAALDDGLLHEHP